MNYSIPCPCCGASIPMETAPAEQLRAAYEGMEHKSPGASSFVRIPEMWNGLCVCGAVMAVTRFAVSHCASA